MIKNIEIKLTNEFAVMPSYANPGDAGMDLSAAIEDDIYIYPGHSQMITSGIAININDPHIVGLLVGRSGLGCKQNIRLSNSVGVIDSGYQQTIGISLHNDGTDVFIVKRGMRIAQLLFVPVIAANLIQTEKFSTESDRGGFGSSGI